MENKFDKVIVSGDYAGLSLRDIFQEFLLELIIDNPPKRFFTGNSDWITTLYNGLAQEGVLPGGVQPCCDKSKWCDKDAPCGYDYNFSEKRMNQAMNDLIKEFCNQSKDKD